MPAPDTKEISAAVQRQAAAAWALATAIHERAERPCEEVESSRLLADYLQANGFSIEWPFPAIPTAFRAHWGRRGPAIGLLGEYDALPDCGPRKGEWGHGCGHNLLGTAPAAAAVAAREVMEARTLPGRLVYYGCPAEETLVGKAYMARDGAFRDLDACLAWHPSGETLVKHNGGAAVDSLVFEFFGHTAHGASAHHGRSALDGAILMDVAANYLREHIPENVRLHSVIPCGGDAPNVVPGYAKSWYYVRARNRAEVDHVRGRLLACARGAAQATGTKVRWKRQTAIYERLPNETLSEHLLQHLVRVGPPVADRADRRRAAEILGKDPAFGTGVAKRYPEQGRASSDEDTVSWLAPFCRFNMACYPKETPSHHRNLAAQAALPYARKGMLRAARVFAAFALDLCGHPALLRRARAEFARRTRGFTFDPLIPKSQRIPR